MLKKSITLGLALGALVSVSAASAAEQLRIGLVSTLSGPGAGLGQELKHGWDLGLERLHNKIGGLETEIYVLDDQLKTDKAVTGIDQIISQHKVQVVAGVLWSNILLSIYDRVIKSGAIMMSTNAGPPQLAGKECNRLFISTSWQNDQFSVSTADMVMKDGIKEAMLMAPNYEAGKDISAAFAHEFKGKIVDKILFKLGQSDFQADISLVRAKHPQSLVIFAPGGMAIAFLKQWHASGLASKVKLYTINMVDSLSLPAIGNTVIGTFHVSPYNPTGTSPANVAFVKAYVAKYGHVPTQYAAQAYDAVALLDSGIRAVGGKLDDRLALIRAMRKADFPTVRGHLGFNVNNLPIQDWHKLEVILGPDKKPMIRGVGVVVKDQKDDYYRQCKLTW
jgi:branched-chain amino acid transport system substrate-binding protein